MVTFAAVNFGMMPLKTNRTTVTCIAVDLTSVNGLLEVKI